jgi:hypothetical protein
MVFLGLHWDEKTPVVRWRANNEDTSQFEQVLNMQLNYRIDLQGKRVCLGHTMMTKTGSRYNECRNNPRKGRKCSKCSSAEAVYAANLHHAHTKGRDEITPEFRRHMEQPNYLYLARFGDGSIKVGTTTAQRKDRRLQEQGAWQAIFVAKTFDGFLVRTLEDLVTEELSIQQAVSTKKKISGIVNPKNSEKAMEELVAIKDKIHHLFEYSDDYDYELLQTPWENIEFQSSVWKNVHLYPRSLATGAHSLQIIALIGRVAAFTPDGSSDVFVADLDELFGIELEIGVFPTEDLLVQDSLF